MPLSWNEIRSRAIKFSKEWEHTSSEDAEAKSFLDGFFDVFGISRRRVATFEQKVRKLDNADGFIDMLWKGQILVEMKSRGKNLDKAYKQATDYFPGLKEEELPRCILICDFEKFRLFDLDENTQVEFSLKDLHKHIRHFGFLIGMQLKTFAEQDPVNIKAAEKMGKLHDQLEAIGYSGHALELYLVRLVFCLFADDTGIFEKDIFHEYIKNRTNEDGSNLASSLSELFYILNTAEDKRLKNLDEDLAHFPYVNGKLFAETLPPAAFDSGMRKALLECCALNWSQISPAIFGSLFQSVMNPQERRNLGAHYTSEKNILKVIKPLFLDDLQERFQKSKNNRKELVKLHEEISLLRFLDPACGCGNFLIVAYRELRLLELNIITQLFPKGQAVLKHDLDVFVKVNVDRFYGIEYEEFPAQIAQVAMWLIDHQMNTLVSETFGENYIRLPLQKSATIVHGNALRIDWQSLIDPLPWEKKEQKFDFIFGNPPFVGKQLQNAEQKKDLEATFHGVKGSGVLDYVTCWYIHAAKYMTKYNISPQKFTICAFVSTNSICQGEQVGLLWNELFNKFKIEIHFTHRTFKWSNEAKGNAGVYVVIIGFSTFNIENKIIYEYTQVDGEPHEHKVKSISPYLVEGGHIVVNARSNPICDVPEIHKGNQPTDGGFLILTDDEKKDYVLQEPQGKKFIKKLVSAKEYLHNEPRWCFWLSKIDPNEFSHLPILLKRIKEVRDFRMKSTFPDTRKLSNTPYLFRDLKNPKSFIVIPAHTSENRKYIPFGFLDINYIPHNSIFFIPNANLYHFGILISEIHMSWVRFVCGRLESRFRYSKDIVYNNFPWPESPTENQKKTVEEKAQQVLDVRKQFPGSSLADLYDPLTMPPALVKAHNELDKAVDLCYRSQPFASETKRIEYLFELYDRYTSGLFGGEKGKKRK